MSNRCTRCGQIETLNHILNGCKRCKHKFTKRHDEVVKVLCKYLTERRESSCIVTKVFVDAATNTSLVTLLLSDQMYGGGTVTS